MPRIAWARERGTYFETLVLHHLRVRSELLAPPARLYFWRLHNGQEVDFVVEHGRHLLAIEIQVGYGNTAALRQFLTAHPQTTGVWSCTAISRAPSQRRDRGHPVDTLGGVTGIQPER